METVHLSDNSARFMCIVDGDVQTSNAKRRSRQRGKLRKCGFDLSDLSRDFMISLDEEGFEPVELEQLNKVKIEWLMEGEHRRQEEPLKSFADFQLNEKIKRNMIHYNYNRPLPIQRFAIPYIRNTSADIIVHAQTGSGKTLAYVLPIIQKILELKHNKNQAPNRTSPYAVIVAPCHELVKELAAQANRMCENIPAVRVAFAHGQLDMRDSKKMLDMGCDLLFTTAGRLHHYFNEEDQSRGSMLNTKNLCYVVLDEADRLLEQKRGFKRQTANNKDEELPDSAEIVKTFVDRLTLEKPNGFRVFMFSATYESMTTIKQLVVWENCVKITVGSSSPVQTVLQSIVNVKRSELKMSVLMDLLDVLANDSRDAHGYRTIGKTLIFVNDIRVTDRIAASLLDENFNVLSINSERSARQRHDAMLKLQRGEIDVLVSTDVLARGVNINQLDYVINYDIPRSVGILELTHRVGRCGRIGNRGKAITFFDPKTDKHAIATLHNIFSSTVSEL